MYMRIENISMRIRSFSINPQFYHQCMDVADYQATQGICNIPNRMSDCYVTTMIINYSKFVYKSCARRAFGAIGSSYRTGTLASEEELLR